MPKATVNNRLRFAGRTAIVTGAGRGIGRAIADLYAREGAQVVIASRSADVTQKILTLGEGTTMSNAS